MSGWIVAAIVLLVAVMLLARQRTRLRASGAEVEELRRMSHEAQARSDRQRTDALLGTMLVDLAPELRAPPAAPPATPPAIMIDALRDYAARVREYDAAVEYCLQPAELMPGADEDDLERLIGHVANARKRLFDARKALLASDTLERLPTQISQALRPVEDPSLAAPLATVASAGRDGAAIDPDRLFPALAEIARARDPRSAPLETALDAVPTLPAWPWLAPFLLQLLRLGLRGCATDKPCQLHAAVTDGHVTLHFSGARAWAPNSAEQQAINAAFEEARPQLDERGAELLVHSGETQVHGFTLTLPASAPSPATA